MSELSIVGGDQRKVGYYTGITVRLISFDTSQVPMGEHASQLSVYYLAEAVTVLQWNRLSDHVGRKPILLSGLLGTTVSITLFGLSRSFWTLALWYVFAWTVSLRLNRLLMPQPQPLLGWRAKWERGRCKNCTGRTYRRYQRCPRVLFTANLRCGWPDHRVRLIDCSLLLLHIVDISYVSGLSLVASYRAHRTAGQITSHIPSGQNTHISSHVWS